jgi:hypothetical protein
MITELLAEYIKRCIHIARQAKALNRVHRCTIRAELAHRKCHTHLPLVQLTHKFMVQKSEYLLSQEIPYEEYYLFGKIHGRFGGTYYLRLHGRRGSGARKP